MRQSSHATLCSPNASRGKRGHAQSYTIEYTANQTSEGGKALRKSRARSCIRSECSDPLYRRRHIHSYAVRV